MSPLLDKIYFLKERMKTVFSNFNHSCSFLLLIFFHFDRMSLKSQYCFTINAVIHLVMQVTACAKCNSKKGQKTLEEASMKLIKVPKVSQLYLSMPTSPCYILSTSCSSLIDIG